MGNGHKSKLYFPAIFLIALMALFAFIKFYDGFDWALWPQFVILAFLTAFFHATPVDLGGKISYSISTAVIFPVIYLFGTTSAMLLVILGGLVDGCVKKKSWDRIVFNISQFTISALAGSSISLACQNSGLFFLSAPAAAIALGGLGYVFTNILFVTAIVSIWSGCSWAEQIANFGASGLLISLGSAYIGFIFTLFAVSYDFWGVLLFGILLLQLATLLRVGAVAKGEKAKRKELEQELVVDEMTQVYNFRYLSKWLSEPLQEPVAALFLDIDDFKSFNDRYGHGEGDRVLGVVAQTMEKSVRADDKVIRYGGEEFVVILPKMDSRGAKRVAQRILDNLRNLSYADWQQPLTVSIGIACAPQDAKDKYELLFVVDQAMYRAKDAGKNTFHVWTERKGPA
ncbi:MAG: GGDEF domain-containing protein [Firmicutes bacterium]|nr:GGDEF domain-containing protein [Bacillota bacterium]